MRHISSIITISLSLSTMSACTLVPARFDVPYSPSGTPLVESIVQRIRCELADLVQDEIEPKFIRSETLLRLDYHVAMLLSIDANDTAAIAPSLSFPGVPLSVNISPLLKLSRQDTINLNLKYSMRDVYNEWKENHERFKCPDPDTKLAGNLGIRAKVASALDIADLTYNTSAEPTGGIFSGVINFTATKGLNQAGPTWTLTRFIGPGPLFSGSEVNTDKLAFGFAAGPNAFKPYLVSTKRRNSFPIRAEQALGNAITNDLGTQLTGIRNALQ